jgi:AcrR family transcriptional regulator
MTIDATPARGTALRDQVLRTALALFSRDGYFKTSIHDIRREAGVSTGSIYHHFTNKESLAKALYDDLLEHMEEAMLRIMADNASCHDRCREVIRFLFEAAEEEPETMNFALYAKHREFMPSEKPICSSRPFELMRQMVTEGISAGTVRPIEPWVAATALFGGALRMISLRLDGALPEPLPTYLEEVWDCAWRAVQP